MITVRPPRALRAPGLPAESDSQLARRVRDGDEHAFEVLFGRYRDPLSRYCRAVLRHDQDAEDAFQQTMIRAYRALGRGAEALNVRPWLFRIAHNECLRVVGTRRPHDSLSGGEESAPADGPAERAETREELAQLRTDLLALPSPQRAALVLRELSGLSHRQIAETLGASPETAKQLIHEARVSLGEYSAGRSLACDDVRRRISDGDGRVLRARAVASHLRGCEECRAFRAGIARRPRQLAALFPALPGLLAARGVSAIVTGAGSGAAGAGALGGASLVGGIGAAGAALVASAALLISTGALAPPAGGTRAAPEGTPAASAPAATAPADSPTGAVATGSRAPARVAPAAAVAPDPTPGAAGAAPAASGPAGAPAAGTTPGTGGAGSGGAGAPGGAGATAAAPGVTLSASSAPGTVGAGATVAVPSVVPGVGADAAVDASVGTGGATAEVGVGVSTPVTPSVDADVEVGVTPEAGVEAGVTAPVLGLPPVSVRVPPLDLADPEPAPDLGGGGLLP